jgi:hypothetical protein
MTVVTITTHVPAPRATPRGAIAVGLIINFVKDALAARQARQARHALAKDAAALRQYALSFRDSDPSLVADLMAAADRAH